MPSSRWGRRWIVAALVLLLLAGSLASVVPLLVIWRFESALLGMGAQHASVSELDLNPINGAVTLRGVEATGPAGRRLYLESIDVDLSLAALFEDRLLAETVRVSGGDVDVALNPFSLGPFGVGGTEDGGLEPKRQRQPDRAAHTLDTELNPPSTRRVSAHRVDRGGAKAQRVEPTAQQRS